MKPNRNSNMKEGVWPGYVAAVAGLVQSLLFVSAVVATVVYLLGMLGTQQASRTNAIDRQGPVSPTKPSSLDKNLDKLGRKGTNARSSSAVPGLPLRPEYALPNAFTPLELSFPKDELQLDGDARLQFMRVNANWMQSGAMQWRLIGHANEPNELGARRAHFRLQEIRNLLIEQGVDPRAVELRILPSAPPDLTENKVLIIASPVAKPPREKSHE